MAYVKLSKPYAQEVADEVATRAPYSGSRFVPDDGADGADGADADGKARRRQRGAAVPLEDRASDG